MSLFRPKRIDIQERGLSKVLGSLEADIVRFIWSEKNASARCVCDHLNTKRPISFNAINTVLGRLVEKGILCKEKKDGCFEFTACYTQEKLYKKIAHDVFSSLIKDKKIFSVASFADVLNELSPKDKKELIDLLKKDA